MPYHVGAEGSNECSGFPVVDDKGKVHGCHPSKSQANRQVQALYANNATIKAMNILETALSKADTVSVPAPEVDANETTYQGCGCPTCQELNCDCPECPSCGESMDMPIQEGITKRDYSTNARRRMASSGTAMPDGSYPIANRRDLMNAIRSWGRGGAKEDVKRHIMSRARSLGAEDLIPENWKSTSKSIWSFDFKPHSY